MFAWKTFAILVPITLVFDFLWLAVLMKGFYAQEIGELTRRNGDTLAPRWGAALFVYLLIPAGIVLFVRPLLGEQATLWNAFTRGMMFGLVLYGVYDLTNLAVLEKWTLRVTIVDIAWGGMLCGTMSTIMQLVDRAWK